MTDVEFRVLVDAMRRLQRTYDANPGWNWCPSLQEDLKDLDHRLRRVHRKLDELARMSSWLPSPPNEEHTS